MKRTAFRQGSALLIVLGMVAFMVVSAVGFSVFMRESRKPSSHLRRNITARLLLRAALANAIARVDGDFNPDEGRVEGVYDDLYPGAGPAQAKPIEENGDYWDKRVFMPFGPVDPRYTVSTLTLESLAYLPPAIINEVRVWSRLTRTAEWKNLSYDLGRYAFCAVDVSDCFDINKVRANERRTSASNHRFNLSSLYPDNAQQLDTVLDKVVNQDPASFISLADFNVVAGRGCPFAPWMNYIGMGDGQIYTRDEYETVSNALFITDTWFPPTNSVGRAAVKTYNLEGGGRNQPWTSFSDTATIEEEVLDGAETGTIGDPLFKVLQGVGMVCLYDYLDQDQVPISYTMPCTETAPMVCAVGIGDNPDVNVKMKFNETVQAEGDYGTPVMRNGRQVYPYRVTVKRCSLKVEVTALGVNGVVAFPFKRAHLKSGYQKNFNGDALFRVFFGPANLKSRLSANGNGDEFVHPRHGRKWDAEPTGWRNGVYTAYGPRAMGNLNFSGQIKTQAEALGDFNVDAECPGGEGDFALFYYVEIKETASGNVTESWYSFDGMKGDENRFRPRNEDGVDLGAVNGTTWKGYLDDAGADAPASPADGVYTDPMLPSGRAAQRTINVPAQRVHVAVWMRLFSGDDTYDVIPARPEDDEVYGDRDLPNPRAEWGDGVAGGDDVAPVLSFREGEDNEIVFNYSTLQQKGYASAETPLSFADGWNRLYVADPRYNFAPENWFAVNAPNGNVTKQNWLDAVTPLFGEDGRDRDIFMFTSDQEYLQSIGELAFLPRVGDPNTAGNQINRHYIRNSDFHARPFSDRIGANAAAVLGNLGQEEFYWRTYASFDNGDGTDGIYSLREGGTRANDGTPCEITAGNNDFRANPFSQDERIMAAVVEDTPFDYFAASTNRLNTLYSQPEDATPSDAKNYVFTGTRQSSAAYVEGFSRLASGMRQEFAAGAQRAGLNTSWQDIYDKNLKWASNATGDDQLDIFGIDLDEPLHCVDRKFLHAFWRECFQNRQQLFLLFLRAEPLTVGGMGFGSLAATQLGARGVALLWRDPAPPARGITERKPRESIMRPMQWRDMQEEAGPHRTRVLFYHPID
ncbi:MAG: hypothetical protein IKA69_06930 [Kiritimatiellae bacterium]|nr:hypothetical protein [Kiritimatiellia bacterium]MBR2941525.1 hypothetical protein [Kiritimatiellia bacterium]